MKKQLDLGLVGNDGPLFEAGCPNCGAQISCYCNQEIRAISFWQPFGSLMLYGKVETRNWATPYRGLVLICTTQTPFHKQSLDKSRHIVQTHQQKLDTDSWSFVEKGHPESTWGLNGYAIAIGRLDACRLASVYDKTFCVVSPVFYAHVYKDVKRIKPFEVKGGQGWFKVTPEMKAKIRII